MFHIKPKLTAIDLNCNIGEVFYFVCLFCEGGMVVYHYRTMPAGHTKGDKFSQYYETKWEVLLMIFLMILQNSCTTQNSSQIIVDYIMYSPGAEVIQDI